MEREEDKERKIDEEQKKSRERQRERGRAGYNQRKLERNTCEFGADIESNKSELL